VYGIKSDSKVSMHGKVIQKSPYMGKIISVFTERVVYRHHGHPARRMVTIRSYTGCFTTCGHYCRK